MMPDDAAKLKRVRELFDIVMDQPPAARAKVLDDAAANDPQEIRREVDELIHGETSTDAIPGLRAGYEPGSLAGLIGQRFGAYEVVQHLGDGGMGTVYEAVRADDEYRKRVAIKLVHRGLDSEIAVGRFRRERQILANLEHRNIATLLDGGVAADGRPFLVMEYIDGTPITQWCDGKSATIEQRLELFDQVCGAVQHAHRNLVVHLDLKPGNILVTDDGTVKLLDFGISHLLGDEGADVMPVTRGGPRAFTPEYASPEHIRGDALTTASDVYSLGVVLFELLAGKRPYSKPTVDVARGLATTGAIPRPSMLATGEAANFSGEKTIDRLRARLKGDLDSIVTMALRPEPERRYASVEALRMDISRHLSGLPVRAQPDRATYRLNKFMRRNVLGLGLSVAVLFALVAGVISTTLQAQRARAEQVKAETLNDFLKSLLSSVRPATGGRDVPVSEVLDSAAQRIDSDKDIDPDVRGQLETVIGQSYLSLARFPEAERHFNSAESIYRKAHGQSMPLVLATANSAGLYLARGDMDSAEVTYKRALAMHKSLSSEPDTLLATLVEGLGSVAHGRGKPMDSERLHRQALAIYKQVLGSRDDHVATAMNNVAVALGEQDKWSEAEKMHRDALAIFKLNHHGLNTLVAGAENSLATALDIEGKNAAAESTYLDVLDMRKRLLGPTHPDYAFTLFNYAMFLSYQGRCKESVDYSREVLALRGTAIPESHPSIASSLQTVGRCLDKLGQTDEGGRALKESYELRLKYLGADSWLVANSEGLVAEHETSVKHYADAERMLLHSNGILKATLGASNPRTETNIKRTVALYEAWGKPQKAVMYRSQLQPAAKH